MYIYYSHLKLGQAESLYLSDLVWTLLTMLQEKKKKKKNDGPNVHNMRQLH